MFTQQTVVDEKVLTPASLRERSIINIDIKREQSNFGEYPPNRAVDDIYSKCAKYFLENQNDKIDKLIGNIASHLRDQDALGLRKDLD